MDSPWKAPTGVNSSNGLIFIFNGSSQISELQNYKANLLDIFSSRNKKWNSRQDSRVQHVSWIWMLIRAKQKIMTCHQAARSTLQEKSNVIIHLIVLSFFKPTICTSSWPVKYRFPQISMPTGPANQQVSVKKHAFIKYVNSSWTVQKDHQPCFSNWYPTLTGNQPWVCWVWDCLASVTLLSCNKTAYNRVHITRLLYNSGPPLISEKIHAGGLSRHKLNTYSLPGMLLYILYQIPPMIKKCESIFFSQGLTSFCFRPTHF